MEAELGSAALQQKMFENKIRQVVRSIITESITLR